MFRAKTKRHTQFLGCLWNVAKSRIIKQARGMVNSKPTCYLSGEDLSIWKKMIQLFFKSIFNLLKEKSYNDELNGINSKYNFIVQ